MAEISLKDGASLSYSGSITGLVGLSGDILVFFPSTVANRWTRLTRLSVTGLATAATDVNLTLVKRSTLDTGGTFAAVGTVPHYGVNAAATTVVNSYTVAPTPGTIIGTAMRAAKLNLALAATGQAYGVTWEFGARPAQCPALIGGSTQCIALAVDATIAGASYDIDFEFTEDIS